MRPVSLYSLGSIDCCFGGNCPQDSGCRQPPNVNPRWPRIVGVMMSRGHLSVGHRPPGNQLCPGGSVLFWTFDRRPVILRSDDIPAGRHCPVSSVMGAPRRGKVKVSQVLGLRWCSAIAVMARVVSLSFRGVVAFVMLDARYGTRAPAFCIHKHWLDLLEVVFVGRRLVGSLIRFRVPCGVGWASPARG